MDKIRVDEAKTLGFPMPVVIIGAEVNEKSNFMTAAWVSQVESRPLMVAAALAQHHTNKGIEEHREFSINIPGADLVKDTDFCGIYSGSNSDKSKIFETFSGSLKYAPMIKKCPVTIEFTLVEIVRLKRHSLYIGEAVGVYTENRYMSDGILNDNAIKALLLTMPANKYYILGEEVGAAWSCGKTEKN